MKKKKNCLLEKVIEISGGEERGRVLDLGCGDGDYARRLKDLGFQAVAADLDEERFRYKNDIEFKICDLAKGLPFPDNSFDYALLLEAIEHLRNPYSVMREINRIIKPQGKLILSTPNILNLRSRMRFLFEGAYEFFREPPLDQANNPKEKIYNLHLTPYRFHELEYLLGASGFIIESLHTSIREGFGLFFLLPFIKLQLFLKEWRALKKGGISYTRINKILLSNDLLYGRHLIIKAVKNNLSEAGK